MRFQYVVLLLAATLAASAAPESPNLIANGSFEEASVKPGSYQDLAAGSAAIRGWTVTQNHIDYVSAGLFKPSDGKFSLDLEGSACATNSPTACLGGVKQIFKTIPGHKYDVSFDLAGNPLNGPKLKILKVSASGASQNFTFDVTGHSPGNMGWKKEHWTFTAAAAETTIEFDSADNAPHLSGWGPELDNVIITAETPGK